MRHTTWLQLTHWSSWATSSNQLPPKPLLLSIHSIMARPSIFQLSTPSLHLATPCSPPVLQQSLSSAILPNSHSQMWLLARLLPIMIGSKVQDDDERWGDLVLLLEIADVLMALEITEDEVYLLSAMFQTITTTSFI